MSIYKGRSMTSKSGRTWHITYDLIHGPKPGEGGKKKRKSPRKKATKKRASNKTSARPSRSSKTGRALQARKAPLLLMAVSTVPREGGKSSHRKAGSRSKRSSASSKSRRSKNKKRSSQLSLL